MRRWNELWLAALVLAFGLQVPGEALALQAAPALTRDFLVGRWTDNGNCSDAVEFNADGSFVTTAGVRGRWVLDGNQLSFIGQQTIRARVTATSGSSVTLTHDDGSVGHSSRCVARRLTMPPLPATADAALRMGGPVDRPFLFGSWTDTGDCSAFIVFNPDGGFLLSAGGSGRWTLEGDRLTFSAQSTHHARVRAVGRDRILLVHPDGGVGQSLRC